MQLSQAQLLPLSRIEKNNGQIEGLPANPRQLTERNFQKLKDSITEAPEMIELRELLVYPFGNGYVTIGGNMRLEALKALGYKEAPCKVINKDAPVEFLRKLVLRDNASYGEWDWDLLLNEWDGEELNAAAIDLPMDWNLEDTKEKEDVSNVKEDDFDEESEEIKARVMPGDIWQLGDHRLICGDSTKTQDILRLMGGEKADLWLTDPPYNVNYEGGTDEKLKIQNDNMSSDAFFSFLQHAFAAAETAMKPGAAFYIWFASREHINFEKALNANKLIVREELIWVKNALVLGRQDYQWRHEPCQPAGTMVLTTTGLKPIEELRAGVDRVVSYDSLSGQIKGGKNGGYGIETASREYAGELYNVSVEGKTTRATDNHQFSIRFNSDCKKKYCTYLMRRGDWWRVGQAKAYDARQFGLKTRLHQEKADEVWLIALHEDKIEAQVHEQILSVKYGIPYTIWEHDRFCTERCRTQEQIEKIYAAFDLQEMRERAHKLLHDFGRSERFPLVDQQSKADKFSTRVTAKIHACNLVPELMQLPIPNAEMGVYPNFHWAAIEDVSHETWSGKVYSLAVEKYEHYIADGIVTHNCLYGWKDGASHNWYNDRSQTTCLEFDKPQRSDMHPTMKPVPLFAYLVANSSKQGDIVLDTFGGSGTTIVACENIGRKARCCELDPHYCDVIVARWEKLTGQTAVKL